MRRLFLALRQKWNTLVGPGLPPTPYQVRCSCGQTVQGWRTARPQRARCPGCQASLFILPRSPWPAVEPEPGLPPPPRSGRSPWLIPLMAAGITLVAVVGSILVILSQLGPDPKPPPEPPSLAGSVEETIQQGQMLLGRGGYREAQQRLQHAQDLGLTHPELMQLLRQARLLANLSDHSLEEIIDKGQKVGLPQEWQALVRDRYRGRSILFDDVVERLPGGQHRLFHYRLQVGEEGGVLRFDLALLRALPLQQPRRLLFGARLANVVRSREGAWLVEFEPDSGVLLTEEGVAATLLGPENLDAEVRILLQEQAAWARRLRD